MNLSEITGYLQMPFHGESAFQIAQRYGFTGTEDEWLEAIGSVSEDEIEKITDRFTQKMYDYTWYVNTDEVKDKKGKSFGRMANCMTEDFAGAWFFVRTTTSEEGFAAYSTSYIIDGANGFLSLRDYVVWTGVHLVHIPTFEAKASETKNSDGKYTPKSGVDGLMSSTDKAYLTDLINQFWNKEKLSIYTNNAHECNKLLDNGVYVGGFKTDCDGHPPYVGGNTTNWVMLVFNNYANSTNPNNHRIQIAIDLSNHLVYFRKGWISSGGWGDTWTDMNPKVPKVENDVILVENTAATVSLDKSTREVVATGNVNLNILMPENHWLYWRCIINLSEAESISHFDVGFFDGGMFGSDAMWETPQAGKTYMLTKDSKINNRTPVEYSLYEVDNLTREMIEA